MGWKGESKIRLRPDEIAEIQDILISQENLTYTELQNLPDDTVQMIYEVRLYLNKGKKMKEAEDRMKSKKPTKRKK